MDSLEQLDGNSHERNRLNKINLRFPFGADKALARVMPSQSLVC